MRKSLWRGLVKQRLLLRAPPLPRSPDRMVVEEPAIKIYPFSIDKLEEDNARYWFHAIEKQMRLQYCWQAIQYYQDIGDQE